MPRKLPKLKTSDSCCPSLSATWINMLKRAQRKVPTPTILTEPKIRRFFKLRKKWSAKKKLKK